VLNQPPRYAGHVGRFLCKHAYVLSQEADERVFLFRIQLGLDLRFVTGDELHLLVVSGLGCLALGLVPRDLGLFWRDQLGVGESLLDAGGKLERLNGVKTVSLAI
jgi:hypothetical protein